jgi:hypothetical protein
MGTITANSLIDDAALMANDTLNIRWTREELLNWLNAGQRAIVALAPESNVSWIELPIPAGSTAATVASAVLHIVAIVCNKDGGAIRLVDRELLDSRYPNWPTNKDHGIAEKKAYCYDPRSPKQVFLWPVHSDSRLVVGQAVMTPVNCTAKTAAAGTLPTHLIQLGDEYAEALVDFMLFRAYAKDTDPSSAQKAQLYYTAFANVVTGNRNVMQGNEPNKTVSSTVLNPNVAQHYARGA